MPIEFNQLKDANNTSNSTKPVFPSYHRPKRILNKFRIYTTLGLILAIGFWGLAYYKYLNNQPYSKYARNIDISTVSGSSLRDPNKIVKTKFNKNENIFTKIEVRNGKNFDANISYLNAKGEEVSYPIKVSEISGNDTRYITFDLLKYGVGKYTTILSIDGKNYLQTQFEVE